ncbi:MAG: MBL fold metallo-hydrolase [Candidatus Aerophobetes bacterium]|nr:MBL fold metallo-hydrolase [Candidatus Aerophobetes bacterium]
MLENISWLGHASFKITNDKVLYIDPWKLKGEDKADIILITHSHYDHLSLEDVSKIQTEDTVIVVPPDEASKLKGNVKTVKPGDSLTVKGIDIKVVPAYNIKKNYHPKENRWVGFIIDIKGTRIYHSGDTDFIPEMEKIKADIALLPIGGTYTMDATKAVEAVKAINPEVAIPMHYGEIVGSAKDARKFKEMSPVKVEILKKED